MKKSVLAEIMRWAELAPEQFESKPKTSEPYAVPYCKYFEDSITQANVGIPYRQLRTTAQSTKQLPNIISN